MQWILLKREKNQMEEHTTEKRQTKIKAAKKIKHQKKCLTDALLPYSVVRPSTISSTSCKTWWKVTFNSEEISCTSSTQLRWFGLKNSALELHFSGGVVWCLICWTGWEWSVWSMYLMVFILFYYCIFFIGVWDEVIWSMHVMYFSFRVSLDVFFYR